ncbi:Amylopullulanase [hydrothermal vent metagenome]|uniref:Amylopullulanase n=1 Tax=hydrothermal vent metagenome TaxID=652676 RepID=A0A3B1BZG5_9ZZZZ
MPAKSKPLKVVIYWHMHQPEYRDIRSGEYHQPWTYLHGIKDYVDMAAHLEAIPEARAVVNFVPILLEQIDDYAQQIKGYLGNSTALSDPLMAALAGPVLPSSQESRLELIRHCLRANAERLIDPFPAYRKLADIAHWLPKHPEMMLYVNDQYLVDLLVWYHLVWIGETVRRKDPRIKQLLEKASGFTLRDRRELLAIIGDLLAGICGRYAALAKRGQVELSMTPYAHPIMPLLQDIQSASEAMPDVDLPFLQNYPGGDERVRWHLQQGLASFEKYFGIRPSGCWPSEGGVSTATLKLLSEAGFKWTASGESVLRNSLIKSDLTPGEESCMHQRYQLPGQGINCFFRDDGLSDLIGFTYSDWHADDAVANFIHHLENIADACDDQDDSVISIILDGENAWEFYPDNGYYFLRALYEGIAKHPRLELTTFSDCLHSGEPAILPELVAGSWVYGTFSTWIGDKDKNRAWDMLGEAKRCYDKVMATGRLDPSHWQRVERQLAICEGSDWFWWFGDYNSAESVSDFESLYRMHLSNLYQFLGEEPPAYLSEVFAHGSGDPALGGAMRKGQE